MARRSSGFITKKPHRKSRGGCFTCKRKKVKCDETQPTCRYCSQRNFICEYTQEHLSTSNTPSSTSSFNELASQNPENDVQFQDPSQQLLIPPCYTAIGTLSTLDYHLMHYYKTSVWQRFMIWDNALVKTLHKDVVPRLGVSHPFLLYAILSIAATQSNAQSPNKQVEKQALVYRQRTFELYKKALQDITAENYEAVLLTSALMLAFVAPAASSTDQDYLEWMFCMLKLSEGLRILAGRRWDHGIETLSVYPLVRRELRTLPPPPVIHGGIQAPGGPLGSTPTNPNPPPTYASSQPLQETCLFLPPSLTTFLESISAASTSLSNTHIATLLPAFHALSPIFLSLYYYHLNEDFYVRISVFPTFLMPNFLHLVQQREPCALVLMAWWFALAGLAPSGWWLSERVKRVVDAIGKEIARGNDEEAKMAFTGAERIVYETEVMGIDKAASNVFQR